MLCCVTTRVKVKRNGHIMNGADDEPGLNYQCSAVNGADDEPVAVLGQILRIDSA